MSELQHPKARSFEDVAELYERARPEYPEAALDWLVERLAVGRGSTVLDLGAGTGKLTRLLVPRVGRVIAVEPGPEMLAQLEQAVPDAEAVIGAAEAIPIGDGRVDAVTCAQSFHWFRSDEALTEIHRVLRPRGGLGLIWNHRDPSDRLQQEIRRLLDQFVPRDRPTAADAVRAIEADGRFAALERREYELAVELDAEGVAARIASISYVAAAPPEARRELAAALRALVAARGESVAFRYRTEVLVTFAA